MFGDLTIADAHGIDGVELDASARRCDSEELALMRAMIGLERRNQVAVYGLPVNDGVEVGKGVPQDMVELAGAFSVSAAGLESAPWAKAGADASVRMAARAASGARSVMGFLWFISWYQVATLII